MVRMIMFCKKKFVGAALSVSFVWFLLVVSLADWKWNISTKDAITVPSSSGSVRFLKTIEAEKNGSHYNNLNLNFVSKRRVPNGPDPIHNRKVGTTKLPPT